MVRRICFIVSLLSIVLSITSPVVADMTIYTNQAAFNALGSFTTEDFNSATLNAGLTITGSNVIIPYAETQYAFAGQNVMRDVIDQAYPSFATTFTFATPINAFGGLWDLNGPGGPGSQIKVYLDGTYVGQEIPNTYAGGFWGVVSSTPFTTVSLCEGSQCCIETYDLENLQYAQVPEPVTMVLLGLGLVGLAGVRRKFKN